MDKMNKNVIKLICLAVFILCLVLVITGRTIPGYSGLGRMAIGLAGLLGLLYFYNEQNK
ncbi:MAG: hypothetical protein RR846_03490 [Oscillospiraceae bacterium]